MVADLPKSGGSSAGSDSTGMLAGLAALSGLGLAGGAYKLFSSSKNKKKRRREQQAIATAGGLQGYRPETFGKLAQMLPSTGGLGFYKNLITGYPGNEQNLQDFLQRFPDLVNAGIISGVQGELRGSPAYQYLQNFQNIDQSMQAFGAGSGQIAGNTRAAQQQGATAMARSGLGRSSAQAALAGRLAQNAAGQKAGLFTDLYQRKVANTAMYANQAFDMQRQIAQLAMGAAPVPRVQPEKGPNAWAQIAPMLGGMIGNIAGGLIP